MLDWLKRRHNGGRAAAGIAQVVGGHHGVNPTSADLVDVRMRGAALGDATWQAVRDDILDTLADWTGATPRLPHWVERGIPVAARPLLLGIVILADWIASDVDMFPFHDDRSSAERAADSLAVIDLRSPWIAPSDTLLPPESLLHRRFPHLTGRPIHPAQVAMIEAARTMGEGLMILEAPMGTGKTEAAFLAAEILSARFGLSGAYIGLPTMATANPMFARALSWLRSATTESTSINLVHGKAALDPAFSDLARESWFGDRLRLATLFDELADAGVSGIRDPAVRVVSWTRGRKRSLFANHIIGTVDQSLMSALKAKHVVLRHLALSGKVVIIDECHAADDYMREYLTRALEWFGTYETPVILMSATLPPAQRQQYVDAYARGRGAPATALPITDSPVRLALVDTVTRSEDIPVQEAERVVHIEHLSDEPALLVQTLRERLVNGGCVAVIRNTVARAQHAYDLLREAFGDDVQLFHSRFVAPQRSSRESQLVAELGPEGDRPDRRIVVGTQVLEQSLDIDLDLLVTDVAPADLVLQRIGRLHRHMRHSRPARLSEPVCLLSGMDWGAEPPTPDRGSRAVYGSSKLLRAAAVLAPEGGRDVTLPRDIPRIVRSAYDPALEAPPAWDEEVRRTDDQDGRATRMAIDRASAFRLPPPVGLRTLDGWIDAIAADGESAATQGRCQVRDAEDSVEVILLQRDRDGVLRILDGCGPLSGAEIPEALPIETRLAKAMAACTVSLPGHLNLDTVIRALERSLHYDTWQASPWLAGQLALVLDSSGSTDIADLTCTYTHQRGLTVTRKEPT